MLLKNDCFPFLRAAACAALCGLAAVGACAPFYAGVSASGESSDNDTAPYLALLAQSVLAGSSSGTSQRSIYLVGSTVTGSLDGAFAAADGDGIDEADTICSTDADRPRPVAYAALLSDGSTRVATTMANCAGGCTGQVDWPLQTHTSYVLPDGRILFTTGPEPIFVFGTLFSQAAQPSTPPFWTGMLSDWTPSPSNCIQWTSGGGLDNGDAGQPGSLTASFLGNGPRACDQPALFLCVER
jgi:hypothetical protein